MQNVENINFFNILKENPKDRQFFIEYTESLIKGWCWVRKYVRIKKSTNTRAALRQAARLRKFPDGNLQRGKKKKKRLDETRMTVMRIEVGGDTNWFIGRGGKGMNESSPRGPVKWMKRKLFNVPVSRGRFLFSGKGGEEKGASVFPLRFSNPFARTTLPDRLSEKGNGIFWLSSMQSRYLHIKISLTPSLKIILSPSFFLLADFA